jgi:hypothetical protein
MPLPVLASVAFLLGVAGNDYCALNHLCMAGHFAHPKMVTSLAYAIDSVWVLCFLVAIVLGHFSRTVGPRLNIFVTVAILLTRYLSFQFGAFFLLFPELPLVLLGVLISARTLVEHYFVSPEKWSMNEPVVSAP